MKALVFFWGQIRDDISKTIDNLYKNFPNLNLDFSITTWDNQIFDESLFKNIIITKCPNREYLDNIQFPFTQQIKNVPEWHNIRIGHYSQFYHNFKISEFLHSNNLNYDVLIKSRTDLLFETDFNFNFENDICYVPQIYWGSKGVGINDHFICGKYEYLKKSLFMYNLESFFPIIENSWNPETIHQNLILINEGRYVEFDCKSYTLLPDRKML